MTSAFSIKLASVENIAGFIQALHAVKGFGEVEELIDLLHDHPKWEAEYGQWLSHGKPVHEDDAGFAAFAAAVDPDGEPIEEPGDDSSEPPAGEEPTGEQTEGQEPAQPEAA